MTRNTVMDQDVPSQVCNKLYKGPINSIIKSKPRFISHANPQYVTILLSNTDIVQHGMSHIKAKLITSEIILCYREVAS
jgi:hypothetical protein